MPFRGRRKAKPASTVPVSPFKTRSGAVRQVKWSPQVDLQENITNANVTLSNMPNLKHTPVKKVVPPLVNTETPQNQIASGNGSGEKTKRTDLLKKKLSYTPRIEGEGQGQNDEEVEGVAVVPVPYDNSLYSGDAFDQDEEASSEEENSSSVQQYEENLEQAQRTPYSQVMSETMTQSHEEVEHEEYMKFVEDMKRAQQISATKDLVVRSARRERERRAEKDRERRVEKRESKEWKLHLSPWIRSEPEQK